MHAAQLRVEISQSRKEQKEAVEAEERMSADAMVQMELQKHGEKMAETARRRRERMGEDPGLLKGVGAFSRFKEEGVGRWEKSLRERSM